ncbi:MAG: glycosyltransferase [Candidatus Helarchaeota archaeon]
MLRLFWFVICFLVFTYCNTVILSALGVYFRGKMDEYWHLERLQTYLRFSSFVFNPSRHFQRFPDRVFYEPEISLLVCSKNEAKIIRSLLDSIVNQEYPKEKLEVLMIDESDADSTQDIILEYSKKHPYIKLINRHEHPPKPPGYNSVAYGLTLGIELARHEIIVITEADCILPPTYLKYMVQGFLDPNVGGISSMGVIFGYNTKADLQRLDMGGLLWHGFGALNLAADVLYKWGFKIPGALWGGSAAFKKSVFYEVGGWTGIEHEHAHDLLLGSRIAKAGYKIKGFSNKFVKVDNLCHPNPIQQRIRWYSAGFSYGRRNPPYFLGLAMVALIPLIIELSCLTILIIGLLGFFNVFPISLIFQSTFNWFVPTLTLDNADISISIILLLILLTTKYATAIHCSKAKGIYGGYAVRKTALIVYPFWFFLQELLFVRALFVRKIKWK